MGGVDLDPAHLRSFLAIVRYGGYHRAADALHLTQPAVSRHIRRLEEQLGDQPLQVRVDRSAALSRGVERGEVDLAITLDPLDVRDPVDLGPVICAASSWRGPIISSCRRSRKT